MQTISAGVSAGCISALDKERLETLIERTYGSGEPAYPPARTVLQRLRNARMVTSPDQVPRELVTMNSTVSLVAEDDARAWEVVLVFPEDHDPAESCWSVLHPVGAALFGMCVGDSVEIPGDDGVTTRWRIAGLPFQPEAKGFLTM